MKNILNQKAYDRIAEEYAKADYRDSILSYLKAEELKVKSGGKILDLGCGPGNNFPFLLTYNPVKLVALDYSDKMIEEAKKRFANKVIEYRVESYLDSDLKEKFDFIAANLSLVNTGSRELLRVLNKIKSWLRDKGVFYANYFEGDDKEELLTSDWGKIKEVKRIFYFYRINTLRSNYAKARLRITKLWKTKPLKGFIRINILAEVE